MPPGKSRHICTTQERGQRCAVHRHISTMVGEVFRYVSHAEDYVVIAFLIIALTFAGQVGGQVACFAF